MTPEQAMYHKLMLPLGLDDEYDRELDRLLEEQDPLSPLVLELAFCQSDRRETISVLHNFLLDHPADEARVCDRILADMTRRYLGKTMPPERIANLLYQISLQEGRYLDEPWDRLYDFTWDLEMYEDGWITREDWLTGFEEQLLCGGKPIIRTMLQK